MASSPPPARTSVCPLVPGADRPGRHGRTDGHRAVASGHGIVPGDRALLIGSGQELATAGELMAGPGGRADRAGPTPIALVAIRGRDRVTGAVDRHRRHGGSDIAVDASCSATGARTSTSSSRRARRGWQGDTLVPVADAAGRTTVASLSVVGSAAGRSITDAPAADAARSAARSRGRAATGRTIPGGAEAGRRPPAAGARDRPPSRGRDQSASAKTSVPGRSGRSRTRATPNRSWSSGGPGP